MTIEVKPEQQRMIDVAVRSGYRDSDEVISAALAMLLEDLRSLDIMVDEEGFARIFGDVHRLEVERRLTAYDAADLELAIREQLPLASLDRKTPVPVSTLIAPSISGLNGDPSRVPAKP